jgi:hypothetical protein
MPSGRAAGAAFFPTIGVGGRTPARADAHAGTLCSAEGKRISIQGPAIVTPAGSHIQGDYSRHFFTHMVPQADPDAGQTVSMSLVNEETVHLRRCRSVLFVGPTGGDPAPVRPPTS